MNKLSNQTTGPFTPTGFKNLGLKVYTTELNLQLSTDKPYLSSSMLSNIRLLAFVCLSTTCFVFSCGTKEEAPVEETLRPIRYAKILETGSEKDQTFSGTVQSSKEAKLSFKVNGTINQLQVKVGDRVRQGQTLATIDAIDYSVQYDQAVAQLKSAETQVKSAESQRTNSQSNYQRVEKLYENNSVPLSEYEKAKTNFEAAQSQYDASVAQVTASQKQVESAGNQVQYARLKAPFAGVITMVNVEENELVGSGSPVATLSAEVKPEVTVGVPEIFIAQIKKGAKVGISFSILPDETFTGVISEVGFSAISGATYPVIVQIDKPSELMRPGMAATVSFHFGAASTEKQFLVAPVKAVGEGTDGNFVFVLETDQQAHKAVKRKVVIGDLLPTGFEVKEGLKAGEIVATAGLKSLLDGMRVKLMVE